VIDIHPRGLASEVAGLPRGAQSLASPPRPYVLWLGNEVPELLQSECCRHGLRSRRVRCEEIDAASPNARMLVIEIRDEEGYTARSEMGAIGTALAHGLLVALVHHEVDGALPLLEDEGVITRFFANVKRLDRDATRVVACYRDFHRVALAARNHEPGAAANTSLVLTGDVPAEGEAVILMRRAFTDAANAHVELLSGGRSGASVLTIHEQAIDRGLTEVPRIAKIHNLLKMRTERSNAERVRRLVDPRLHATLHAGRSVEGHELGLAVYDVVDSALPFRTAVMRAPEILIASLFDTTLRRFRDGGHLAVRSLGSELGPNRLNLLRWSGPLRSAAHAARDQGREALAPEDLAACIAKLQVFEMTVGTVHGDLHAENLFVPATTADVIMIDYGSLLMDAPLTVDPACLEVSLCWPPEGAVGYCPPLLWRDAAFTFPLIGVTVPNLRSEFEWLPRAVRAIRAQAQRTDGQGIAYSIAVAGYLIRFAAFDDHASLEQRTSAYAAASTLIMAAAKHCGVAGGK
jgi:hypothetical protein